MRSHLLEIGINQRDGRIHRYSGWPETILTELSSPHHISVRCVSFWKPIALAALVVRAQNTPRRPAAREYDTHNYYIVEHDVQPGASIHDVAKTLGVEVVEPLGELDDHWVVRTPKLSGDLEARGFDPVLDAYHSLRDVALSGDRLGSTELELREKRAPPPIKPPPKSAAIVKEFNIEDPYFPRQWHLGITGKGVLSGLIDDGLDYTSEDLAANFDAKNSYDFNDHEALPTPKKERDHHGTRCAGQIAAVKNRACGIGIAYESKVSGIRILSGRITTADEAIALNYGFQDVHLYSCSWGPRDDGTKMQGPSYIIRKAVLNGINKGRGGKGSVFVFASGNGAHHGDQCNFDGYTNSIYSVTVGSVDYKGLHPKYSEALRCCYGSSRTAPAAETTSGKNGCATNHGGTSAAAPNAAGVIALALSVRPDLTWRDVQHLCVQTARQINPHDSDWSKMASGKYYSNKYGFGVLDGWSYVQAAKTWKLVKPQAWIETPTIQISNGTMDEHKEFEGGDFIDDGGVSSTILITKEMLAQNNFEKLEHVTVRVWIDHTRRGDVEVYLESPNGIRSVLAKPRERDNAKTGFPGWEFMSAAGGFHISDQELEAEEGYFLGWNMQLWGESIDPAKAKLYEINKHDDLLPPFRNGTITPARPVIPPHVGDPAPTETHTTLHGKPTDNLPHGSTTPPPPGWLSDLSKAKQNWLMGVVAVIILLNFAGAIYYCRKHFGLWGDDPAAAYNALPGARRCPWRTSLGGAARARARGGGCTTWLRKRRARTRTGNAPGRSTGGLGFHSGFLDDDDPLTAAPTAGVAGGARYRDDDGLPPRTAQPVTASAVKVSEPAASPEESSASSEDGNLWEDARAK
ncbi:peptidase S8/S53 domain-containing protein [Ephemerocybe angulata]|uniref:Peptidase S8/S53 domain-containing protein n=1 Tax=Ephemerocybe angulata TaxID=980116 RepID=A0A8H6HPH7_9AGAR|nr:peptidase S8/S53 domain-containing protein [Tulosesus angulatus]